MSCSNEKEKPIPAPALITLFLQQPRVNRTGRLDNGTNPGIGKPGEEITIMDDSHVLQPITIKYFPENDTVNIGLLRSFTQVNFRYKTFDELDFLFKKGDSVIVEYDSSFPVPKITNRVTKPWDLEFERSSKRIVYHDDYSALQKSLFGCFLKSNLSTLESVPNEYWKIARRELEKEDYLLDSLQSVDLISPEYFSFYKTREKIRLEIITVNQSKGDPKPYIRPEWSRREELLNYTFFRNYLLFVAERNIYPGINTIWTSNMNIVDYRVVFDKLGSDPDFTIPEKEIMRYEYLAQIIKSFSNKDIQTYFRKFEGLAKNKKLVDRIQGTYNLNFGSSDELILEDTAHQKITFRELLQRQKGTVVYVDFWASWCGPCIASLPDADKLKKEYDNKDVSFIYLSRDEDFDRWIRAAKKYHLVNANSFLVANQFTSKMIDDLAIVSIPRYVLYNKNGELVQKNAPGPETKDVRRLLNSYLK